MLKQTPSSKKNQYLVLLSINTALNKNYANKTYLISKLWWNLRTKLQEHNLYAPLGSKPYSFHAHSSTISAIWQMHSSSSHILFFFFLLNNFFCVFFLITEMLSECTKTLKQQQQFNYLSRECNRSMKLKKMNLEFLRNWILELILKGLQGLLHYKLHLRELLFYFLTWLTTCPQAYNWDT